MARKWIITDDEFRLGNVQLHRDLASETSEIDGGGYFYIDRDNKKLYLYSKSIDFGSCTIEEIRHVILNGVFPTRLEDYEWYYSQSDSLENSLKDSIKIKGDEMNNILLLFP